MSFLIVRLLWLSSVQPANGAGPQELSLWIGPSLVIGPNTGWPRAEAPRRGSRFRYFLLSGGCPGWSMFTVAINDPTEHVSERLRSIFARHYYENCIRLPPACLIVLHRSVLVGASQALRSTRSFL